jgi:hypothetical protein
MRIPIKVVLEEEGKERTETVTADSRDVRTWESENSDSFLSSTLSVTQISQLAFYAMRRTGLFKGSWDVFDASAIDVEGVDDEEVGEVEPASPTKKGRAAVS